MKLGRRGFLKGLLGAGAAVVAAPLVLPQTTLALPPSAPLFVPAQNLDMGVPRMILTATEMPKDQPYLTPFTDAWQATDRMLGVIPMLLLQDNYIRQYGGKLKMGTELLVDRTTAERWVTNGIAVPGAAAPQDLQLRSAQRVMKRTAEQRREEYGRMRDQNKTRAWLRDNRWIG